MPSRIFTDMKLRMQGQRLARATDRRYPQRKITRTGTVLPNNQIDVNGTSFPFRNTSAADLSVGDSVSVINIGRKASAIYAPSEGGGIVSGSGGNGSGSTASGGVQKVGSPTSGHVVRWQDSNTIADAGFGVTDLARLSTEQSFTAIKTFEDAIDFTEISEPAAPAANDIRVFPVDESGFTVLETKDSNGHVFRIHEDTFRIARNTTGVTINKGDVVYFASSTGNKPNIALARANDESTMPAIGVAAEDIANNDFGIVTVIGRIEDVDTSAFSEGAVLYVSPTTAGALTATRPTHPNFAQFIGTVEVSGVGNGAILLDTEPTLLGRDSGTISNDFTIGDETAGAKTLTFDNGNEAALSWNPTAGRTVTIPDATGTVALTTVANVFEAAQTINEAGLRTQVSLTADFNHWELQNQLGTQFGVIGLKGATADMYIGSDNDNDMIVIDRSTGDLLLKASALSGNVGVGLLSNPLTRMHIKGASVANVLFGDSATNTALVDLWRNDSSILAGNPLGQIDFSGSDNTAGTRTPHARIIGEADGTHAAGDNPTRIGFWTTPAGSETLTEAARIVESGHLLLGTVTDAAQLTVDGAIALVDGMTAPSATSGFAKLFVDSSGGDLKVVFGDGTVKTIALDS